MRGPEPQWESTTKALVFLVCGLILGLYLFTQDRYVLPEPVILLGIAASIGSAIYYYWQYRNRPLSHYKDEGYTPSPYSVHPRTAFGETRDRSGHYYRPEENIPVVNPPRTPSPLLDSADSFMKDIQAKFEASPKNRAPQTLPPPLQPVFVSAARPLPHHPVGIALQEDRGILCDRDFGDKTPLNTSAANPNTRPSFFADMPSRSPLFQGDPSYQPRFFRATSSFADEGYSRREGGLGVGGGGRTPTNYPHMQGSSTPLYPNQSYSLPRVSDRQYVPGYFDSQRGTPLGRSSVSPFRVENRVFDNRNLGKRSTVMVKESVTAGSVSMFDRKNITAAYSVAVKSLEELGGEDVVFQQSIAYLQKWVPNYLLEKVFEDNRKNLLALNNLLSQFNKMLFEVDLLTEERTAAEQTVGRTRAAVENLTIRKLKTIFTSAEYSPSVWTKVLGGCRAKSKDEVEKINGQLHTEIQTRMRLDQYFNFPDHNIDDVRSHCIRRLRDLRGYENFVERYTGPLPPSALPNDAEILVHCFVCFVLDRYPGLDLFKDQEAIFRSNLISKFDGSRVSGEFKVKKTDDNNYYCKFEEKEVVCQKGNNNPLAVMLYFVHYIRRVRLLPDVAEGKRHPDSQRVEGMMKAVSLGGRFRSTA
jgi:hypothetical protein